jgi:hypothetical protein
LFAAGVGKAKGTMQVAALGHFQQHAAGLLAMVGAEAAVKRAALLHLGEWVLRRGWHLGPDPTGKSRLPPPDDRPKETVPRTAFFQVNLLASPHAPGWNPGQTFGANAFGGREARLKRGGLAAARGR